MLALVSDVIVFEKICVIQHDVGPVRKYLLPIRLTGRTYRGLHQAVIASRIVYADVKEVSVVVGIVFNVLLARLDHFPFGGRLIGRDVARLARSVTSRNEKNVRLAPGAESVDAEALIPLLIDQVVRSGGPHGVTIQAILPLR